MLGTRSRHVRFETGDILNKFLTRPSMEVVPHWTCVRVSTIARFVLIDNDNIPTQVCRHNIVGRSRDDIRDCGEIAGVTHGRKTPSLRINIHVWFLNGSTVIDDMGASNPSDPRTSYGFSFDLAKSTVEGDRQKLHGFSFDLAESTGDELNLDLDGR
ncbi:hypothetical protein L1987_54337 [Smallanthus sonchifolius]|uniref:Uncharacterized protein n=1 Tax=Smallanthus sonchifolius TaxID=185202 RepID=A0ACB9E6Y3_9ASTR|nr:hypothetical protein L1987_54337 [Smallanthus sonchifolius]